MVAITVILAAVIGAFVLEIGDQQETAPSSSFDSEQVQYTDVGAWDPGNYDNRINLTRVDIAHAGGDVVEKRQTRVRVNGNASTYQITELRSKASDKLSMTPNKDVFAGTNEPAEFTSGQTWKLVTNNDQALSYENVKGTHRFQLRGDGDPPRQPTVATWDDSGPGWIDAFDSNRLENGDEITVVWSASSGGKTQTLFKYTVQ